MKSSLRFSTTYSCSQPLPICYWLLAIGHRRLLLAFEAEIITMNAMAKPSGHKKRRPKAIMLGLGLDTDGHRRITTGDNFALVGGSKDTHEEMTEKVLKINEKLMERGKQLEQVCPEEFNEIAHAVGLRRAGPDRS